MNHKKILLPALALICAAPLARADLRVGVNIGVPIVREAPPPPIVERVGPPPRRDYVWVSGHWAWNGRWVWLPGRWERLHAGSTWMPGHWDRRGEGWVWVEGQWVAQYQQPQYAPQYAPQPYQQEVYVQSAPPAAIVEDYGPAPGPDYLWISGHWGWHNRWAWEPGRWERRRERAEWENGRWEHRREGNVWIEGRWRDRDDRRDDRR